MTDRDHRVDSGQEDLRARERLRYQWMLDSVSKFRLFFVGLVFAMLSFSVQFAVQTTDRAARWCQVLSWIFLGLTGMLALRDAGGLIAKNTEKVFDGLPPRTRRFMWLCFTLGVVLLAAARFFSDGAPNFRLERMR